MVFKAAGGIRNVRGRHPLNGSVQGHERFPLEGRHDFGTEAPSQWSLMDHDRLAALADHVDEPFNIEGNEGAKVEHGD